MILGLAPTPFDIQLSELRARVLGRLLSSRLCLVRSEEQVTAGRRRTRACRARHRVSGARHLRLVHSRPSRSA